MKVIQYLRGTFYLLEDKNQYIFDVNSGRGAVGFSISIALSDQQKTTYLEKGTVYLEELANYVHQNQSTYLKQQIDKEKQQIMHAAIMSWLKDNNIIF